MLLYLSLVTSLRSAFGLSSSGGELALVVAKGGADVGGSTSSMLLPMIGTMTIITTFIIPYMLKFGWKAAITISEHYENIMLACRRHYSKFRSSR